MWEKLGKASAREDSAEADLFKLLIDDLSIGRIIRQHREVDYHGNYIKKQKPPTTGRPSNTIKSAFNNEDPYELTALGEQFVHYAMTEVTIKIEYHPEDPAEQPPTQEDAA